MCGSGANPTRMAGAVEIADRRQPPTVGQVAQDDHQGRGDERPRQHAIATIVRDDSAWFYVIHGTNGDHERNTGHRPGLGMALILVARPKHGRKPGHGRADENLASDDGRG